MVAKGGDNRVYLRFIEKTVRWLTKDPGLSPISMVLPEKPEEGQDVEVRINAGEEDSGVTRAGEQILFSVFGPQGVKLRSHLGAGVTQGEHIGSFKPEKAGTYRVRVETRSGSLEEALVIGGQMEELDGAPDHEILKSISAMTGGKVLPAGEDPLKEIRPYLDKKIRSFVEEREMPLWSLPYVLSLVVALLCLEWFLRRRWGLA